MFVFKNVKSITEVQLIPEEVIEKFYFWKYFGEDKKRRLEEEDEVLPHFQSESHKHDDESTVGVASSGYEGLDLIENLESLWVIILSSVVTIVICIPSVYYL